MQKLYTITSYIGYGNRKFAEIDKIPSTNMRYRRWIIILLCSDTFFYKLQVSDVDWSKIINPLLSKTSPLDE